MDPRVLQLVMLLIGVPERSSDQKSAISERLSHNWGGGRSEFVLVGVPAVCWGDATPE